MSTHARHKTDVAVLGTKYLSTIRNASVPVIAIKHPEHEFVLNSKSTISISRIRCPCDLTLISQQSVPIAADLCRHFWAELVLAHFAETYDDKVAFDKGSSMSAENVNTYKPFDHLMKLYEDVPSRIITLRGNPKKELPRICRDENIDLVVMAKHDQSQLAKNKKSSFIERFIIDAPCPIFTILPELHNVPMQ
jgi:nucleotide-binding universal stress UspA family protein